MARNHDPPRLSWLLRAEYYRPMFLDHYTLERMKYAAERWAHAAHVEVAVGRDETGPVLGGTARSEAAQAHQPLISLGSIDVLRSRDFRLLWAGEFVSLLGDQFFNVALPWLVLQLTGNALAIGTVLAVGGAPRAVFLLLGGALIDRFSPRAVMLYSNVARLVLVAILAVLTVAGMADLWMLYVFSLLLGFGYALYLPAQSAMIPRLVSDKDLQGGNALIQGTAQLSLFLGPVMAGVMIALLGKVGGTKAGAPDTLGIGIAFAFDALTFLASAITLAMIVLPGMQKLKSAGANVTDVFRSIVRGLGDVWHDKTLRLYFVLIGIGNLALLGPLQVGVPILAHTRFSGGALAYGAILSGLGAGALVGLVSGGTLRRPPGRRFAAAVLGSTVLLGCGLLLLGVFQSIVLATLAAFIMGVAEGYMIVVFITWLQLRTSRDELGRMMSVLLLVTSGQAPLSNLIAGALIGLSVSLVMMSAGGLLALVAVAAAFSPSVWRLGETGDRPAGGDPQ